jgi:hypothetical protein
MGAPLVVILTFLAGSTLVVLPDGVGVEVVVPGGDVAVSPLEGSSDPVVTLDGMQTALVGHEERVLLPQVARLLAVHEVLVLAHVPGRLVCPAMEVAVYVELTNVALGGVDPLGQIHRLGLGGMTGKALGLGRMLTDPVVEVIIDVIGGVLLLTLLRSLLDGLPVGLLMALVVAVGVLVMVLVMGLLTRGGLGGMLLPEVLIEAVVGGLILRLVFILPIRAAHVALEASTTDRLRPSLLRTQATYLVPSHGLPRREGGHLVARRGL